MYVAKVPILRRDRRTSLRCRALHTEGLSAAASRRAVEHDRRAPRAVSPARTSRQGQRVHRRGQKDVERLCALGLSATTSVGGAGSWREDYTQQLVAAKVKQVVVLPDNDDAGRAHAEDVARSCHAVGLHGEGRHVAGIGAEGRRQRLAYGRERSAGSHRAGQRDHLLCAAAGASRHAGRSRRASDEGQLDPEYGQSVGCGRTGCRSVH